MQCRITRSNAEVFWHACRYISVWHFQTVQCECKQSRVYSFVQVRQRLYIWSWYVIASGGILLLPSRGSLPLASGSFLFFLLLPRRCAWRGTPWVLDWWAWQALDEVPKACSLLLINIRYISHPEPTPPTVSNTAQPNWVRSVIHLIHWFICSFWPICTKNSGEKSENRTPTIHDQWAQIDYKCIIERLTHKTEIIIKWFMINH